MSDPKHTNRLINETSPYLLQHAHNPVDWFPWGNRALRLAKLQDKPILLSVGYSACHWCHVMERESFEDEATAAMMNRYFVCIKVDREERPDVDEIYMKAVQAFSKGRGGWPMTVFLTPEGKPFFGGTYFPPEPRGGLQGFRQVLAHVHMLWTHNRPEVDATTEQIQSYLEQTSRMPRAASAQQDQWLARIADAANQDFDERHAGFGYAPKFPPHGTLSALLVNHWLSGDDRSLTLVTRTLDAMARGGMYDVIGGGFARYSVDDEWRIPHFEKMLYDNALLVPIYVDAWQATGDAHYKRIATESLDYVLREMTHPEGGFCAAQDADSEGVEGKFFVWTPDQLNDLLGEAGPRVAELLDVTAEGTFERGASVLRLDTPLEDLAEADRALLARAFPKLLAARNERIAPGRDDKVLTAWNALMISAFARAGAALGEQRYTDAASKAAQFILDTLQDEDRLLRTWRGGKAHLLGYADDYAYLVNALVDLHQATFQAEWLDRALHFADETVRLFWDDDGDGLFYTGSDAEELVVRSKNFLGGAVPSANGVAALGFARLATLCGRDDLGEKADKILLSFQSILDQAPRALGVEALAGAWRSGKGRELAIVGPDTDALLAVVRARHEPLLALSVNGDPATMPWLEGKTGTPPQGGPGGLKSQTVTTAYLCQGYTCQAPTTDPAELDAQLAGHEAAALPAGTGRDAAPALPEEPDAWLNRPQSWRERAGPISLDSLKGHVVVLHFWSYSSINCTHVLGELAAVEDHFAGRPVAVIGVHSAKFTAGKDRDNVLAAIGRLGIRHPVVLDPEHKLRVDYTVASWPTVVVLDTEGRISWGQPGEVDRDKLIGTVERLLDEATESTEPAWATESTEPAWATESTEPAWATSVPTAPAGTLAFPGKVRVYPGAAQQQAGADAFSKGLLYITDSGHHRIIEAALEKGDDGWPTARILRSFGTGERGFSDGADGSFADPQGIDRSGTKLWVADTGNHALRVIDLDTGAIKTMAGTGALQMSPGGDPSVPTKLPLRSPWDVSVAGQEAGIADQELVFIAMAGNHQIWIYMPGSDRIGPMVGGGREDHSDGAPPEAALAQPSGLELFGQYLFFADSEISSVRVFDMDEQKVSTLVGKGLFDFGDVDGKGDDVRLQHPLAVTASGTKIWVADTFNNKIKSIDMVSRETVSVAGGDKADLWEPGGIAVAGEFLIIADTNNHRLRAMHTTTGELRDLPLS